MVGRLRKLFERFQRTLVGRLISKFGEDQGANQAVLVAWNGLFSMFPIVLVILGVLGLVLNAIGFDASIVRADLAAMFPDPAISGQIQKALGGVKEQTGLFFVVGFAGLLWSGTNLFGTMEYSFAVLFHAPRRGFLQMRLMAVGMIAIFTVLTVIAVGTASVLPLLTSIPGLPGLLDNGVAALLIQVGIGVATGFLLFGSMYYVVPNRRQRWSGVWPGAVLAGVLFEVLSLAFPLYLRINKGLDQYGKTFGLLFVLMTFFWFLGLITMLGAELNALLYPVPVDRTRAQDEAAAIPPPPAKPPSPATPPGPARSLGARAGSSTGAGEPRPPRARGWKRVALGLVGVGVGLTARRRKSGGRSEG